MEDNFINDLLSGKYKIRNKTYFEVADKIEELRNIVQNTEIPIEERFFAIAGFMKIYEEWLRIYAIRW